MASLTYTDLTAACTAGGSSTLVSRTDLVPAAGEFAAVAPAKFVRGSKGAYAYEPRFVAGEQVETVLIDSKQSSLNRIEAAINQSIDAGDHVMSRVPRIAVRYSTPAGDVVYTDLELPHRAFDAHIRAGTVDGEPVTATRRYRDLRNATPANARALLETSPGSLAFGSWDSTRKAHQGRWRSVLVGEIVGVVPDGRQRLDVMKGGARVDPVAMQVNVGGKVLQDLADAQREEMSEKTYGEISKTAKTTKAGNSTSASQLGFGGIPPSLSALAGVNCSRIIRSHVLSFAALRQMRFGSTPEGDAACRALLAAYALAGLARSDRELYLRANCDLREAGPTEVELDERGGNLRKLEALAVDQADDLLLEAISTAERLAGVAWDGQVFEVKGNEQVFAGALEAVDDDGE